MDATQVSASLLTDSKSMLRRVNHVELTITHRGTHCLPHVTAWAQTLRQGLAFGEKSVPLVGPLAFRILNRTRPKAVLHWVPSRSSFLSFPRLLLGNILHFCLLWFSGWNPHLAAKFKLLLPFNVNQVPGTGSPPFFHGTRLKRVVPPEIWLVSFGFFLGKTTAKKGFAISRSENGLRRTCQRDRSRGRECLSESGCWE